MTRPLPLTSVTSSPLSALLFRHKSSAFPLKSADSRLRPSMLRHHLRPHSFSSVSPLVSRLLVTFPWAPTNPSTSLPPSPYPFLLLPLPSPPRPHRMTSYTPFLLNLPAQPLSPQEGDIATSPSLLPLPSGKGFNPFLSLEPPLAPRKLQ